jgi:ferric-dicitrate binding protein FerR (iron transport regulator)
LRSTITELLSSIVYILKGEFILTALDRKNIKDLLDKFRQGNLNREELDFLFHSINHNLHNEEILAWFYRYWDESESRSGKIKSSAVFHKIRENITSPEGTSPWQHKADSDSSSLKYIAIKVAKYAATLVLGFTVALFIIRDKANRIADAESAMNQISIPLGSKSKIVLADGSQVWLNSGSTISYPGIFSGNQREIFLAGEAFFDIKGDKTKPFIVRTSEIKIKVLGTQFNVKSYPEENTVETTVISGMVEIETKPVNSLQKHHLKLEPNQKAVISKSAAKVDLLTRAEKPERVKPKPVGKVVVTEKINPEVVTAWKDEKLLFAKERFEDILIKLERWYDVEIILEDEKLENYTYTGTFHKESLEQALDALKLATPFEYTIDKNSIIIYGRNE